MFDPRTELASHPAHSFHPDNFGKWGEATTFCSKTRKMGQNLHDHQTSYRNWNCGGGGVGGEGIQFRLTTTESVEESGVCSPPLWRSTSPVQSRQNSQNNTSLRFLSPTCRRQAIARGQNELMEMVKNMPESSYELSLKDLVEQTRAAGVVLDHDDKEDFSVNEEKAILGNGCGIKNGSQRWRSESKGKVLRRNTSIDRNKGMLLKMGFVPFCIIGSSSSKKKKSSSNCVKNTTCAKVSPKPEIYDKFSKNGDQREWWKKRFAVPSDTESGGGGSSHSGSTGRSGSTGSSDSSRSNSIGSSNRRETGRRSSGCWPFFHSKEGKSAK